MLRGHAFAQRGLHNAARIARKEAMRVRNEPAEISHRATCAEGIAGQLWRLDLRVL